MPTNYEDYLEQVVNLKRQFVNNGLIAKEIRKQPDFVSRVLKYAKSKGYEFPKLSISANKNNRRGLVTVSEKDSVVKTSSPKVTHLRDGWRVAPATTVVPKSLDLAKFKKIKVDGKSTGLHVPKNFWLFD